MKKLILKTALSCFILCSLVTACANEGKKMPVTTIKSNSSGQPSLKIEYSGIIKLTDDKTAFKSISPKGYVNYQKGDKKLVVESSSEGQLLYEIQDNNKKLAYDETGKKIVSEVISEMLASGFKQQ